MERFGVSSALVNLVLVTMFMTALGMWLGFIVMAGFRQMRAMILMVSFTPSGTWVMVVTALLGVELGVIARPLLNTALFMSVLVTIRGQLVLG